MAEIKFHDCELKELKRTPRDGGVAKFSCSLTLSVCKVMGWMNGDRPAVSDYIKGATPEGELASSSMTMQLDEGKLADFHFEIKTGAVYGFTITRRELEGKRGKGHRFDLSFSVDYADLSGSRYLEEYMVGAGDSKGTLTVRYEPKAIQTELVTDTNSDAGDSHTKQVDEIIERSKKKNAAGAN